MGKNVEFNFDKDKKNEEVKSEEKKQFESAEIKELTDAEQTEAPADDAELTDNASEGEGNQNETEKEADGNKAVVTYIGNGVWRDSEGKGWARTENRGANILSTRSYDKAEYDKREDLKFMVKYGEMKLTLV